VTGIVFTKILKNAQGFLKLFMSISLKRELPVVEVYKADDINILKAVGL